MFLSAGFLPEESQVFSLDAPLATVPLFSPERGNQRETLALLAKRLVRTRCPRGGRQAARPRLQLTPARPPQVTFCVAMHEYPYVRFRASDPTACAQAAGPRARTPPLSLPSPSLPPAPRR